MADVIRRADLEAQEVSYPDYILDKVLPFWDKQQIAGNFYFQLFKDDVAAQYDRDHADLDAIDSTTMKANSDTFACKELRSRVKMAYTQFRGYGSEDGGWAAMGRMAKRSWYNSAEVKVAKALLDVDAPKGVGSNLVSTLEKGVTALRDMGVGRIGLVCSNHNLVALKGDATIKERMVYTGVIERGLEPRYIAPSQIASMIGVDEIVIGKDDLWYAGLDAADRNNVALVILPEANIDPAETTQLGRTIYFQWADSEADKFVMESWHDADRDAEVVDAKGLIDIKIMNPKFIKVYNIADDTSDSESESL